MQRTVHTEAHDHDFILRLEVNIGRTQTDRIIENFFQDFRCNFFIFIDDLLEACRKRLTILYEERLHCFARCVGKLNGSFKLFTLDYFFFVEGKVCRRFAGGHFVLRAFQLRKNRSGLIQIQAHRLFDKFIRRIRCRHRHSIALTLHDNRIIRTSDVFRQHIDHGRIRRRFRDIVVRHVVVLRDRTFVNFLTQQIQFRQRIFQAHAVRLHLGLCTCHVLGRQIVQIK